ncbi:MAG: dihydrolipoyllysine-residue succinyltransferase [Gammaproteobacteria bacterium]|nr:MAG: dihydrolipoyllysine-residue succinyltransferase [Gammaproteobacteria bacterium]
MSIEINAPQFPESVADGTIATWHKQPGEPVMRDELLVDIETDKVVIEVVAPADGQIKTLLKNEGDSVLSDELLAIFEEGSASVGTTAEKASASNAEPSASESGAGSASLALSPAVRKLVAEHGIDAANIKGSGKDGRILKEDVLNFITPSDPVAAVEAVKKVEQIAAPSPALTAIPPGGVPLPSEDRIERRVPMTRLRARVAERLVQAQQTSAMLTTFNEVNMKPIMEMRKNYKEQFEKVHGVRMGFMAFFVRAVVESLKRFPEVNASIDGNDVVYHSYYDIGVAVSSSRGLVVPVLRDADKKGLGEVEAQITGLALKARDGKLTLDDMTGGTFTLSNGGVFGSLLSTPILNPPQTGILGMHKIQERAMVVNGEVVVLPMMYLALSYDHRLIDGKEAVGFLVQVKQFIEDPARLLLEI